MLGAIVQVSGNDIKSKQYMAEFNAQVSQPSLFDPLRNAELGTNFVTGMALARLGGMPSLNQKVILSSLEHVATIPTYNQVIVQRNDKVTVDGSVVENIGRNYYQYNQDAEETYESTVVEVVKNGVKTDVRKTIETTLHGTSTTTAIKVYMRQTMILTSLFVGPRTILIYGAEVRTSMLRIKIHTVGRVFAYHNALLTNGLFHVEQYAVVGVGVGTRIEKIRMVLRNVGTCVQEPSMSENIYAVLDMSMRPLPKPPPPPPYAGSYMTQNGFTEDSSNIYTLS